MLSWKRRGEGCTKEYFNFDKTNDNVKNQKVIADIVNSE